VDALRSLHWGALLAWVVAAVGGQVAAASGRRGPADREARLRRRLAGVIAAEHLALTVLLLSGLALAAGRGWTFGHPRWFGVKLGLVLFLLVPIEGMHAYVAHFWIARGIARTRGGDLHKDLSRGLGMEEMLRTLSIPLLGVAVPLIVWLSLSRPF
jgi:hypothetical protein